VVAGHEGITVLGGLEADSSDKFSTVGRTFMERLDGEGLQAFRLRVLTAAMASKEHAIFGGLPPMAMDDSA
jgi:hypothetical protein